MRTAEKNRTTQETKIDLKLNLDGTGKSSIATGIAFFDHMLTLFAKHGLFDLELQAKGDIEVDFHHTVEDVGIVLGDAIKTALADKKGIRRYGFFILPMDEARAVVSLDLSGRAHLAFEAKLSGEKTGDFEAELVEEFFKAVANQSQMTLHIVLERGSNLHHQVEAIFKAFARALSIAVSIDPRVQGVPSTKGVL